MGKYTVLGLSLLNNWCFAESTYIWQEDVERCFHQRNIFSTIIDQVEQAAIQRDFFWFLRGEVTCLQHCVVRLDPTYSYIFVHLYRIQSWNQFMVTLFTLLYLIRFFWKNLKFILEIFVYLSLLQSQRCH